MIKKIFFYILAVVFTIFIVKIFFVVIKPPNIDEGNYDEAVIYEEKL